MESMLYRGHRFLGGAKHFWMAVRVWKTNLVLEDLARQKRTKMWPKWGLSWCLTDVWQNDWQWVEFESPNRPHDFDRGIWHAKNLCRIGCCIITATLPFTLPSPWTNFWPKRVFRWFRSPLLAWCESVWLLPFPEIQTARQRLQFWNCGQHPEGRDRPAEGTSTWRIPALLPGVGATSPAVCGFPRELLRRG